MSHNYYKIKPAFCLFYTIVVIGFLCPSMSRASDGSGSCHILVEVYDAGGGTDIILANRPGAHNGQISMSTENNVLTSVGIYDCVVDKQGKSVQLKFNICLGNKPSPYNWIGTLPIAPLRGKPESASLVEGFSAFAQLKAGDG